MSLLNVFPHKLVTPLSIIDTTSASPVQFKPSFPVSLVGVHQVDCVLPMWVHHQRIISNVVLSLSLSFVLKLNELHRWPPKPLSNDVYITVVHVLSLSSPF